jgi:hypothetical protein
MLHHVKCFFKAQFKYIYHPFGLVADVDEPESPIQAILNCSSFYETI